MKFNIFRRIFSNTMKIDFKMTNYPGMTLSNEVRESTSLEEDDLSDVEDEVFIRDGKNSYKTAEEIYAKRPLMAPRRRSGKQNISTKIKNKPPCRAFCKPCCYFLAALSVLIGLIVIVIILVAIFPLPLDRIHDWIVSKFVTKDPYESYIKLLPCSDYKVTDVWTTNLPKLTTDSPMYLLDVNNDTFQDVLFGFGTGDNYGILPSEIFCSIFMGVSPPCEGGLIALNGVTGDILWRYWTNDTIYFIHCSEDINRDGLNDCLIIGTKGTISIINARNGTSIWNLYYSAEDITIGTFIGDQNNDTVPDILASQTNLLDSIGYIVLISGKSGDILRKISAGAKTFYMPQMFHREDGDFVIFGTGGPNSAGNLSVTKLETFLSSTPHAVNNITTVYQNQYSGVIIQSVLVDITGDQVLDIIIAMYNSTVVAINGCNFSQIWNFTVEKSQTNTVPVPGYFNFDNITDFLIIYETYDDILKYNYTKTYILDGETGKPIYEKPISGSIGTQIGGLSISLDAYGYDMFLFWTSECENIDIFKKIDFPLRGINVHPLYENCNHQENTTAILKLNMLNQFDQPPGIEIYNSLNRSILEFNSTKSPMQIIRDYFNTHPKFSPRIPGQAEIGEGYDNNNSGRIGIHKYGNSNFRHKDNKLNLLKNFPSSDNVENFPDVLDNQKVYNPYYESSVNIPEELDDYSTDDETNNRDRNLVRDNHRTISSRDPRSKSKKIEEEIEGSGEAQIQQEYLLHKGNRKEKKSNELPGGIYDYKNIRLAKNRLLHDLNNSPDEILSDTFFKNLENRLRSSKFEQRDLSSHNNKQAEEESITKVIEENKKLQRNISYNLWNMESEKEEDDRKNNFWRSNRRKRQLNNEAYGNLRKVVSIGAIADSLSTSNNSNSIDVIFLTYWQPTKYQPRENLEEELAECVEEKLAAEGVTHQYQKTTDDEKRSLFLNECVLEQSNFKQDIPYFNDIYKLNMGQMTVYRLKIECQCNLMKENERCAKFSPSSRQKWSSYLGNGGNGIFGKRYQN